jgi:hypothetical protein
MPVFVGANFTGGVTFARVLHVQTCPQQAGVQTVDGLSRVVDASWKQEAEDEFRGNASGKKGGRR